MLTPFRQFCENHFSIVMLISLVIGLLFPVLGSGPDILPPMILAVMMGFSCATITLDELKKIRVAEISLFYVLRFFVLPLALFGLCALFLPEYRYVILLLGLLPVAVSAAYLSIILGGNSSLGLAATVLSSIIAPFMIPAVFAFTDLDIEVDVLGMFMTLAGIVFLPAFLYYLFIRRIAPLRDFARGNAGFVNVLMFSAFIIVVIAKLQAQILADIGVIISAAGVLSFVFLLFYALGWMTFSQKNMADRVSFTLFSGCINMGLGISLGLLYFPEKEKLYLIVCEFLWVFSLSVFQYFLKFKQREQS